MMLAGISVFFLALSPLGAGVQTNQSEWRLRQESRFQFPKTTFRPFEILQVHPSLGLSSDLSLAAI
jgi:hypothetical protein